MAAVRGRRRRRVAAAIAAAAPIALRVAPSLSTVYRTLVRHGRSQLHPPVRHTVQRYEKTRPGELVHVDLKYLPSLENRGEFEFAAVDDFTREAVVWIAGATDDAQCDDVSRTPRPTSCRIRSKR